MSHLVETLGLVDGRLVSALGEEVGGQIGLVRATNALDPDAIKLALEGTGKDGASSDALGGRQSRFLLLCW